jgi:long-chain fatty acid transport protein
LISGKQVAGALNILKPSFKYSDNGSTGAFASPPASSNDGGDGGDWAYVPNAFFTMAINPKLSFGLALNVPFGLKTEYDTPWRGQLTAVKSEIKSVNINPSIAFKVSDAVSIGAGVSIQKLEAELTSVAPLAALGTQTLKADDIGYGYNLGVFFQASPSTRIGAHYRSTIKYELEGTQTFSGTGVPNANSNVTADLKVPDSFSLSLFQALGSSWELLADATWTGWSSLQQLTATRTTASSLGGVGSTAASLPFQWDDTWRYSVGANFKLNPVTKFRFGLAFDQTPTNDATRTPRLPDQDRTWAAFGVQYKPSKTGILDFGYAHEFIKDATVNTGAPPSVTCPPSCLNGTFTNKADIFSIQYSQSF